MEIWKSVAGHEGSYEVSTLGRVRSLDKLVNNRAGQRLRKGRVLKPTPDRAGYMQFRLSNGSACTASKAHRLVAFAFLGKPPHPTAQVNHLDFDKANNRVKNLKWCTPKQNHTHARVNGRFDAAVSPRRAKKLSLDAAIAIKAASRTGESTKDIALRFGVTSQTVGKIIAGRIWIRA